MPDGWPKSGWTLPLARKQALRIDRPLVMGILNATPDSFSDGGRLETLDAIRSAVARQLAAGADILDVGGESTRPGHTPVLAGEESARVNRVIREIRRQSSTIAVSVDTRKGNVASLALEAGASFVNDVSGLADRIMPTVVRMAGCAVVVMRDKPLLGDPVESCRTELADLVVKARSAGIPTEHCILDPGLGFGTPPGGDPEANMALLRGVSSYSMGRPVLIGASRKRFVGALTGVEKAEDRVAGSVAAAVEAVRAGAAIVRVHDMAETVEALRSAGLR
ncbi:MAG: dihydropteroate synthase [bacterium]